jgi:hypothetical protein
MSCDGVRSRPSNDGSEYEHHDDGIVRVADHRDEVRYEIDGRGEVGEEEPEPDPQASWKGLITSEAAREADNVGNRAERFASSPLTWTKPPKHDQQREPAHNEGQRDREDELDCSVHRCVLLQEPLRNGPATVPGSFADERGVACRDRVLVAGCRELSAVRGGRS